MKAFVIIMLSFAILQTVRRISKYADKGKGSGVLVNIYLLFAFTLALIFACQLH